MLSLESFILAPWWGKALCALFTLYAVLYGANLILKGIVRRKHGGRSGPARGVPRNYAQNVMHMENAVPENHPRSFVDGGYERRLAQLRSDRRLAEVAPGIFAERPTQLPN